MNKQQTESEQKVGAGFILTSWCLLHMSDLNAQYRSRSVGRGQIEIKVHCLLLEVTSPPKA